MHTCTYYCGIYMRLKLTGCYLHSKAKTAGRTLYVTKTKFSKQSMFLKYSKLVKLNWRLVSFITFKLFIYLTDGLQMYINICNIYLNIIQMNIKQTHTNRETYIHMNKHKKNSSIIKFSYTFYHYIIIKIRLIKFYNFSQRK